MRRVPYCEILHFDEETNRGLANLDGLLVIFAGKVHQETT